MTCNTNSIKQGGVQRAPNTKNMETSQWATRVGVVVPRGFQSRVQSQPGSWYEHLPQQHTIIAPQAKVQKSLQESVWNTRWLMYLLKHASRLPLGRYELQDGVADFINHLLQVHWVSWWLQLWADLQNKTCLVKRSKQQAYIESNTSLW